MTFTLVSGLLMALTVDGQRSEALRWFKGNTHTHTTNSDGDSSPSEVVKWYKDHGYNFVVVTDHEFITPVNPLNDEIAGTNFLVISGQEVTDSFDKKPYHINGLGLDRTVKPAKLAGAVETLQKNIDNVIAAGAVPQLNHPNFGWALKADDIKLLRNVRLMEIYNGHPLVNNLGGGDSQSVEDIWDQLLTAGHVIYGIGDDDSHHFKRIGDPAAATPGRAWVFVRSADLTPTAILRALNDGDFYASTGVELEHYSATAKQISLKIKRERWSKYTVRFIGTGGRILKETHDERAVYDITGNEGYVRAKILESNGKMAWTQPVFIKTLPKSAQNQNDRKIFDRSDSSSR